MRTLSALTFAALGLGASLFTAPASAYVGQWHSYTDKNYVTALTGHNGFLYAGTKGGIRRISPITLSQIEFDNLDGLLDVWITSFMEGPNNSLWAVSRDGYLYALKGSRWEATGRSYASLGWKMNDRAALTAGSNFYLGSEKGLTLFDPAAKISQLNIVRFQSETDVSVLSLLRRNDTLYAGTTHGVYKIGVYFENPLNPPDSLGYVNLADPNAWVKVLPDTGYSLAVVGDSVVAGPKGSSIETPVHVEAFLGSPLLIGPQTYYSSKSFTVAAGVGGRVFVGGSLGLFVSANPSGSATDAQQIGTLHAYPRDTIYNIGANAGVVWGHSRSSVHKLSASGEFIAQNTGIINSFELTYRDLRNVRVDSNGDLFVGVWGSGLNRVRAGTLQRWSWGTDTCIYQSFPPADPWTVVQALSAPQNGGLYFAVSRATQTGDHQLVYFDTQAATITCPTEGLSVAGNDPHAVHAFSDTLLGVASDRGLSLFKTRRGLSGPTLDAKGLWTLPEAAKEAWDLATDRWGRPWALIGGTLASVNLDSLDYPSASKSLDGISNFSGEDCKSLEADAAGTLWVGCINGLYSVNTGLGGDLAAVRRYGLDDGLLSLKIHDVSVDPVTGKVWIATDRGVSMLEGDGPPALPSGSFPVVIPYPNPFKPQHRAVIFDNLPRNSTLRIYNAAGNIIRIFHPRDLTGNQAQWNGLNEQGKPVTAGVYLFSVVSGSNVQRGKVIVAR